jgi:hypothetical protein
MKNLTEELAYAIKDALYLLKNNKENINSVALLLETANLHYDLEKKKENK